MPIIFVPPMQQSVKAIIASAYRKSFRLLGGLFSQKTLRKVTKLLYDPNQSDELKAFSAALGVFLAIIPIWGLQTLAAISLAVLFRLNKALVFMFSHVSFAPVFPFIILMSFKAGGYWMDKPATIVNFDLKHLGNHLQQYLLGSFTLAVVAGVATWSLIFATLKIIKAVRQSSIAARLKKVL
jgi:uncharacterized protein (DUF2062 family)